MIRNHILVVLLWLSVIMWSTWIGGTLYQMLVIVPMWSASPPESVRSFFQDTDYNRLIFRFFGPPFMVARLLPVVAALFVGWHSPRHRYALLVAVLCLAFAVIVTLAYVYRINAILFEQAGGNSSAEEIRTMVDHWILADRVRFGVGIVAFLAILRAFKEPMPQR